MIVLEIIIAFLGILFMIVSGVLIKQSGYFSRMDHEETVMGRIVDLKWDRVNRQHLAFPTVLYEVDGKEYTVNRKLGTNDYRKNKKIKVSYNYENPAESHVAPSIFTILVMIVMFFAGLVIVLGTIYYYWVMG